MSNMKVKLILGAAIGFLAGCAGSPTRLSQESPADLMAESNYNLCRASVSPKATRAIDEEVQRRKVNCAPYVAEAARRNAATSAALEGIAKSFERPPTLQTQCTQYGNTTNCTTY